MTYHYSTKRFFVAVAATMISLGASADLAPLAQRMVEANSFERQVENYLADNARRTDAMITTRTAEMAAHSDWITPGPEITLDEATPSFELISTASPATLTVPAKAPGAHKVPGTVKYGSMFSKDMLRTGVAKNFAMQLTSTGGKDSVSNIYGLGTKAAVEIDAAAGTVRIPAQKIYDHSSYGPVYICPATISGSSVSYDRNGTISGTIDAYGNITLPAWGVFVVEGSQAGGAFAIFTQSNWFASNSTIRISLTDNSTINVDSYVEQNAPNEITIYNFAGTGAAAKGQLTHSGNVLVAPQYMVTLANYGDFYCYAADWEDKKLNMSTSISGKTAANTIVFGSWALAVHRSATAVALGVTRSVVTLSDGSIELPPSPAPFSGQGTESSPFLIKTADDLLALSQRVQGGESFAGQFLRLEADIDLSATSKAFYPVGDLLNPFGGIFDGNGHSVKNFTFDAMALGNAGLFGYTSTGSEIKNLTLTGVRLQGKGSYLGGICGTNYGKITGCSVNGDFSGESLFSGGITGAAWGPVTDCSFTGTMTTIAIAGGIAGTDFNEIRNCHVDAHLVITGALDTYYHDIAGIAGVATPGKDMKQIIADCSFTGSLTDTGGYGYMAGITCKGLNATIERCANTAAISGIRANRDSDVYAGGIIAWSNECTITDCLNSGTIVKSGLSSQGNGGIAGYFAIGYQILQNPPVPTGLSRLKNCINTGQVVSSYNVGRKGIWGFTFFKDEVPDPLAGCLVGCYNDYQATGLRDDALNASTATLTSGQLPQGFSSDSWKAESGRYPVLKSMPAKVAALAAANVLLSGSETTNKVKKPMTINSDPAVSWALYSDGSYVQESAGLRINGNTLEIKDTYSNEVLCARTDESHYKLYRISTIPDLFEGEGTAELPYLISNVRDFINLDRAITQYSQTHEGDYFKMTGDIDFNYTDDFQGVALLASTGFGGTFDGDGHTIRRLKIHTARFDFQGNALSTGLRYGGLFSKIMAEGTIKNLTIAADCDFIFHEYGGAVAGSCVGRIENCRNYAEVKGVSHYMGGIAGQSAAGTVSRCYNAGKVLSAGYGAAGIVAENIGRIEFCQNDGEISAENYSTLWPKLNRYRVGGIAGLSRGEIEGCVNQGPVRCLKDVGGIVGESTKSGAQFTGNIINCLSTGPVECTGPTESTRGAIAGKIVSYDLIAGNVYDIGVITDGALAGNSHTGATGISTATLTSGSLAGNLPDSIFLATSGSYPVLRIFATEEASLAMSRAFPIFEGKATRINTGASLPLSSADGLTWTLKMADKGFSIAGNNLKASVNAPDLFAADTLIATTAEKYVKTYPVQILRKVFEGEGTASAPYLIRSTSDMRTLAEMVATAGADYRDESFLLTTDLDFTGEEFLQVASGIRRFQADFNGDGKKITYAINDIEQKTGVGLGLFGTIGDAGVVRNLTVAPQLNAYSYSGGIAAYLYGSISGCTNTGSISTVTNYAGGLTGVVYGGGRVTDSRNQGTVNSGASYAAGIAALVQAGAEISGCSNSGKISATASSTGGIVGNLSGTVKECTNSGIVTARSYTGGIVGGIGSSGNVKDCSNTAEISSTSGGYIAGIVGNTTTDSHEVSISGCSNSGNISATSFAAGIVSQLRDGISLDNCINSGTVTSAGNRAGGITAKAEGKAGNPTTVSNSSNSGKVTAAGQYVGGVVGQLSSHATIDGCFNTADIINRKGASKAYLTGGVSGICSGSIIKSWNSGDVECDGYGTGGLTGYISGGSVDRCFSIGNVKAGNQDSPEGYGAAGGFVGYIGGSGSVSNSYCTGAVEAPDNAGGFAATLFAGARLTNVYTISKVTVTGPAPKTVSQVASYANTNATDANVMFDHVYYLADNNSISSAPDKRATALNRTGLFAAPLGEAFDIRRGAFPTLADIADNSRGHLAAVSYEFGKEGDSETNITDALWIADFDDIVWTSSPQFEVIGQRAYTKELGQGWIEASLPDGSHPRRFNLTVTNVSGIDTVADYGEIVSRTYFSTDGLAVTTPEAGQIYVERTLYSDGTTRHRRVIFTR